MKAKRIYVIGHGTNERLVNAANRSQAVNHVARTIISARVASQSDLVKMLGRGVAVEETSDGETKEMFSEDE